MKERITLSEGEIFLLTPPLKSDPCYACHLIYLSYQTKGLCAYVVSKDPIVLESVDLDRIEFDTSKAIYASIHFMKWGIWKKLGSRSLGDAEDKLTLRNVGSYNLMYRDEICRQMPSKDYKNEYPLQPVYDLIEVFSVIYGKQYKKEDPRFLAWANGSVKEQLE